MPTIGEQWDLSKAYALSPRVIRLLLQPGTPYEDAVEAFSPYDKIQAASESIRNDAAAIIMESRRLKIPTFVFVNNRCEGSAPFTINAILERLGKD